MRFVSSIFPHGEYCGKLNTVKNTDRTCGIAPDGTREEKTQPVPEMPPREIPGAKDHSPRYDMGVSPLCYHYYQNMSVDPFWCPSATVVGTPDDKSIIYPHHEATADALAAPSAA